MNGELGDLQVRGKALGVCATLFKTRQDQSGVNLDTGRVGGVLVLIAVEGPRTSMTRPVQGSGFSWRANHGSW
jgi:hypothetical protein